MNTQGSLFGDVPEPAPVRKVPVKASRPHERTIRPRSPREGIEKRDAGAQKIVQRLTDAEREAYRTAVIVTADNMPNGFTSEDVEQRIPPGLVARLDELTNARGGAMLAVAKSNKIKHVRKIRATNPDARGRYISLWARSDATAPFFHPSERDETK